MISLTNKLRASRLNIVAQKLYCTATANISDKINDIVKKNKVVVFMKGVPEAPKCGFSNAVVQIMRMHGVEYDSHDVLKDETLRQGIFISSTFIAYYINLLPRYQRIF